jgi:hypothetical protein
MQQWGVGARLHVTCVVSEQVPIWLLNDRLVAAAPLVPPTIGATSAPFDVPAPWVFASQQSSEACRLQ